jgi:putative membrane protein
MAFILSFLLKVVVYAGAVYIAGEFVEGFTIMPSWYTLGAAGFLLAVGYTLIRPILKIITFPLALITLGFSNVLINAGILWGVDYLLPDMTINGLFPLLWGTLILSITSIFFVFF